MKARTISILVITLCMVGSAYMGAAPHWSERDGCFCPAPFIGIGYALLYGGWGFIVGVALSPVAVFTNSKVKENLILQKARQAPPNSKEANALLLRPSSSSEVASKTLLRPAEGRAETHPESLLRASEREHSER